MATPSPSVISRTCRPLSARLRHLSQAQSRHLSSTISAYPRIFSHVPSPGRATYKQSTISSSVPCTGTSIVHSNTRAFSGTVRQSARAIVNPRKDDDGNEMLIDITPRAANRLHAIAEKDNNPSTCLRVTVESGGCHGFQYLMSLTTTDNISPDEDTIFESEDGKNAKVVMDEPSLELLKGSKIDYTMELIGSQFKVTGIPGAKSSCGCGTSFDIQA